MLKRIDWKESEIKREVSIKKKKKYNAQYAKISNLKGCL